MKRRLAAAGLTLGLALCSTLWAERTIGGLYLDQNLQAGLNPVGLQLGTNLFYRMPLARKDGILWESTRIDVGISNDLSPAYDFVGAYVDIEPIAVFDLALKAQFVGYYDALDYGFRDLASYGSGFDSSALKEIDDRNASGYILSAAPTFKFAFGKIAFSDTLFMNYFNVDGGEGYFYEIYGNCVLAKRDIELYNDAYLLWVLDGGFMAGLNESLLGVPRSGYRSQTLQAVGTMNKRLSERLAVYGALTAGLYLEDRYLQYKPRVAGMVGLTYKFI